MSHKITTNKIIKIKLMSREHTDFDILKIVPRHTVHVDAVARFGAAGQSDARNVDFFVAPVSHTNLFGDGTYGGKNSVEDQSVRRKFKPHRWTFVDGVVFATSRKHEHQRQRKEYQNGNNTSDHENFLCGTGLFLMCRLRIF